jgi:hypothetical protein
MNKKQRQFVDYELEEEHEKDLRVSQEKNSPITLRDVDGKSEITVLEEILLRWKPRDLRLEESYTSSHSIIPTDDQLLVDIVKDMILKTVSRNPDKGSVEIGVYAQSNLSEFERYDHVITKHNKEWASIGSPEDLMDPVTGEIKVVTDGYVRPVSYKGPNPYRESDGPLSKARPSKKESCLAVIEYRMNIDRRNKLFTLGYIVKDKNGRVLYYNETMDKDLTALSRRAIQEVFGNNELNHYKGPFYEGVAMLFNGKKIPHCEKNNKLPWWVTAEGEEIVTKEHVVSNFSKEYEVSCYRFFGHGLRYVGVPLIFFIGILGSILGAINRVPEQNVFGEGFILRLIGSIVLMYIVSKIAAWLLRRAYDRSIETKFE